MEDKRPTRKPVRLRDFDYSTAGAYFLTICTQNKRKMLSQVGGDVLDAPKEKRGASSSQSEVRDTPQIKLLPHGQIADQYLRGWNDFYHDIKIDQYVIMPNHVHIMLLVFDYGASRTSPPTKQHSAVSQFVSTFKRFCNKEYGGDIWQRHFNDHIIRDRKDYEEHAKYIFENPSRWRFDDLYEE